MAYEASLQRYRRWYAKLLRLYPKPYRERFADTMEQTFYDLLRECADTRGRLFNHVLWIFIETFSGILRENITSLSMQNTSKRLLVWAIVVAFLLLVPLIAMQFSEQVDWSGSDFLFVGVLLFGAAMTYELISKRGRTSVYRFAVAAIVGTSLLMIWVNGAVGIIGNEDNPVNLMYFAILFVGIIGATFSQLRPRGMERTVWAMQLTQVVIVAVVLFVWKAEDPAGEAIEVIDVLGVNAFFMLLLVVTAALFRQAGALEQQQKQNANNVS